MGAFVASDEIGMQLASGRDPTTRHNGTINASINALAVQVETFLELSRALSLSVAEEATMLDVTVGVLLRLRNTPAALPQLADAKLRRRVDYAVRILYQMRSSAMERTGGAVMVGPPVHQ